VPLEHLPNTATVEQASEVMREHGHVILDELVPVSVMRRIAEDMQPYLEEARYGDQGFTGAKTRRAGCLIARSVAARDLVMHPLTRGVASSLLSHGMPIQVSSTELIALDPGQPAQVLHRDDVAAGRYPFPLDFPVYCNAIWAVSDFTADNGATRVVPGSHLEPFTDVLGEEGPTTYTNDDTVPAEMTCGSVLLFSGKMVHGGGANVSSSVRLGLSLPLGLWWIRQEENQFLACPQEIARTLPDDLLRLMGYDSSHGLGHAGGQTDPLRVLGRA
jgi:hypothetical protein